MTLKNLGNPESKKVLKVHLLINYRLLGGYTVFANVVFSKTISQIHHKNEIKCNSDPHWGWGQVHPCRVH